MLMNLRPLDYGLWAAGTVLELLCLIWIRRRGLHRQLPWFTVYLGLVLTADLAAWWLWHQVDYTDPLIFYIHWSLEALLLVARALVIAELCRDTLATYAGIWKLSRLFLLVTATALVLIALGNAWGAREALPTFIYAAQHGLEMAAVGIILVLLAVSHYYRVPVRPVTLWIAYGIGFYASVQIALLAALQVWGNESIPTFSLIRAASYLLALGTWLTAVARARVEHVPGPGLLPAGIYEQTTPVVNEQLQKLNARLLEILRG